MKIRDIVNLPENLKKFIPTSFDIIGNREKAIAIVRIPEELKDYKIEIAKAIMKLHKNVKTVLNIVSPREGEFRIYNFEKIIGNETEVIHKEFGYFLKLDITKVYFNPREATERQRIASQVKENEKVLVMFSGVAPFAIAIAKKVNVSKIICIEKNPDAHKYAIENVKLNKLENKIECILGDVKEIVPKLNEKFDRILMPLPLGGEDFLEYAFMVSKKGTIIHFYGLSSEENIFKDLESKVLEKCNKLGKPIKIIKREKVLPYAPRVYKVRLDILVDYSSSSPLSSSSSSSSNSSSSHSSSSSSSSKSSSLGMVYRIR